MKIQKFRLNKILKCRLLEKLLGIKQRLGWGTPTMTKETSARYGFYLVLAASTKPHTANARQLRPGTRKNIFQYGVVTSE